MILNETTSVVYEHICLEKHHIEAVYNSWIYNLLLDNNTNELIVYPVKPIWGLYDAVPLPWEILLRKLLHKNCIEKTQITNEKQMQN